ncbi:MAG: serine/threonine-protein phosphatase, partial [Alistipes sp.]|nr:serine/threonine-protein phosphatase [Alistipes sp.]
TALLLDMKEHTAELCHLGDTRLYHFHNQQLERLTRDHSVVAALEDTGRITEAEAMAHPRRNEVTRFVGRELLFWGSDYLTYSDLTLTDGVLLLCSDGLYDMVPSGRIEEVLSRSDLSLEERCRQLLADALQAGGKDNVTILLLDLD